MMAIAMVMCTYLFFSTEINIFLYRISCGQLGRKPKSLLPVRDIPAGDANPVATKRLKLGLLEPGWAKVSVQTAHVLQKKEIEIAGCGTDKELRALVAETFGHVLRGVNLKEFTLTAWVKEEDQGGGSWMVITAASDMEMVCQCSAIQLTTNDLIDSSEMEVAYPSDLARGKARGKGKRRGAAGVECGASRPRSKPTKKKGGFQRVSTDSPPPEDEEGSSDEDEPLCADITDKRSGQNGKHHQNGRKQNGCRAPAASGPIDDGDDVGDQLRPGVRVQLHGLVGKAELNGCSGTVMAYDPDKGRYRVRVEPVDEAAMVMAFKPENLRNGR